MGKGQPSGREARGEGRGEAAAAIGPALALVAAYVLFRWTAALIRLPLHTPGWLLAAAFALTAAVSIGLPIGAISSLVRLRTSRPALAVCCIVAAGAALLLLLPPRLFHGPFV